MCTGGGGGGGGAEMSVEVLCSGAGTGRLSTGGGRGRRREIQTPSHRPHLETNGTSGLPLSGLSQGSLREGDTLDSRGSAAKSLNYSLLVVARAFIFQRAFRGRLNAKVVVRRFVRSLFTSPAQTRRCASRFFGREKKYGEFTQRNRKLKKPYLLCLQLCVFLVPRKPLTMN